MASLAYSLPFTGVRIETPPDLLTYRHTLAEKQALDRLRAFLLAADREADNLVRMGLEEEIEQTRNMLSDQLSDTTAAIARREEALGEFEAREEGI